MKMQKLRENCSLGGFTRIHAPPPARAPLGYLYSHPKINDNENKVQIIKVQANLGKKFKKHGE